MQQIVFKRKFFRSIRCSQNENVQYLEEKIQPIKKIVTEKIQKKKSLKILILRNPDRFLKKSLLGALTPYLLYLHT